VRLTLRSNETHENNTWRTSSAGLGELLQRLVHELGTLIDQRLTLFRIEMKEQVTTATRDVLFAAIGGVIGAVGAVFLLLALAVWIGQLIGTTAGGLAIVGGVVAAAGVIFVMIGIAELRRQRLVPKTREELRRDAEWVKTGT
jgi:uncharacterized membrane protein YqjE